MLKLAVLSAVLVLFSFSAHGQDGVDQNACIEASEMPGMPDWYLVNTCSFAVQVSWCARDLLSDHLRCRLQESTFMNYYHGSSVMERGETKGLPIPLTQDLGLAFVVCRYDAGVGGLKGEDYFSDGSVRCPLDGPAPADRPQTIDGSELFGAARDASDVNIEDANHCITAEKGRRNWWFRSSCGYSVEILWCRRSECGGSFPEEGSRIMREYYPWWTDTYVSAMFGGHAAWAIADDKFVPVTDDFDVEFAACRYDFNANFGIVMSSIRQDGSFRCGTKY